MRVRRLAGIVFLIAIIFTVISPSAYAKKKKKSKVKLVAQESVLTLLYKKGSKEFACDRSRPGFKVGQIKGTVENENGIFIKLKPLKRKKNKKGKSVKSKLEKTLINECKVRKSEPVPEIGEDGKGFAFFSTPFNGVFNTSNYFDHDLPFAFKGENNLQQTSAGEIHSGISGHEGYDWRMEEGTPLYAVADGVIARAGLGGKFVCPILDDKVVQAISVRIDHPSIKGEQIQTSYVHLSEVAVSVGDTVSTGDLIGYSGNTGCSTTPHLHFQIYKSTNTNSGKRTHFDPYGWRDASVDPWSEHPEGTESLWLWKEGQAPLLTSWSSYSPSESNKARVVISRVQYMGEKDDENLNNEYVELQLDPKNVSGDSLDLTGFRLRNSDFEYYNLPVGFILKVGESVKIYSGAGSNDSENLYWDRSTPAWENFGGGCAQLLKPDDTNMFAFRFRGGTCSSNANISTSKVVADEKEEQCYGHLH